MSWILKLKKPMQKTLRELVHDEVLRQAGRDVPDTILETENLITQYIVDRIRPLYPFINATTPLSVFNKTYKDKRLDFKDFYTLLETTVRSYLNKEPLNRHTKDRVDPVTGKTEQRKPVERALSMLQEVCNSVGARLYPLEALGRYRIVYTDSNGLVWSYDFNTTDNQQDTYIYIKGKSQNQVCIKQDPNAPVVVPIADRVAGILLAAHSGGIQYRDSARPIPALVYGYLLSLNGVKNRGIIYTPFDGPGYGATEIERILWNFATNGNPNGKYISATTEGVERHEPEGNENDE